MLQLTQSPFLQALGYTIINSLWQFAFLWLIYVSLHIFLKLSSHQKYVAGLLMQITGFIWFATTFSLYLQRFLQLEEIYLLQQKKFSFGIAKSAVSGVNEKFLTGIVQGEKILPYLSVAYLLILLFLFCKWIRAYKLTKLIKTKGLQETEVKWCLFVKHLSEQLGIKRQVRIYLSEMVQTPLTIGFLKPFILVPLASLNHLTADQMEAVILHELAHIKRFDYLFNLFLALIEIALFFNPFMHLISRHIKRERENCCDDWVLQYNYNAASYADALLQIATCQPSSLLALQAADNKKVLLHRIIRMMEKKEKTFFYYKYQLMALLVMLTVLGSLAILSSQHRINDAAVSPSPRQVVARPMIETVNSALYNPDFFIAPSAEKAMPAKKQLTEKILKKGFSPDMLRDKMEQIDANNKIIQQQIQAQTISIAEQALSAREYERPAEKSETKPEVLNATLDEIRFQVAAEKEQEITLAENRLNEIEKNLLEKNKRVIIQQVFVQLKKAFEQLQLIKIQLNSTRQKVSVSGEQNEPKDNQPGNASWFSKDCSENLQATTKAIRLQTAKAAIQRNKLLKAQINYYNKNNYLVQQLPQVLYLLPVLDKPQSFSFEYSSEPKIKMAAPDYYLNQKKTKNNNKNPSQENKTISQLQNISPDILNKSEWKDNSLLIIRI